MYGDWHFDDEVVEDLADCLEWWYGGKGLYDFLGNHSDKTFVDALPYP